MNQIFDTKAVRKTDYLAMSHWVRLHGENEFLNSMGMSKTKKNQKELMFSKIFNKKTQKEQEGISVEC